MIEYWRRSTPDSSIAWRALASGRTLNAMMIAFEASARGRGVARPHVVLGDRTGRLADEVDLALGQLQLGHRVGQRLDRAGDIALDDEVERLHLALGDGAGEVVERQRLALGQLHAA